MCLSFFLVFVNFSFYFFTNYGVFDISVGVLWNDNRSLYGNDETLSDSFASFGFVAGSFLYLKIIFNMILRPFPTLRVFIPFLYTQNYTCCLFFHAYEYFQICDTLLSYSIRHNLCIYFSFDFTFRRISLGS